jgi:hypothetical protein
LRNFSSRSGPASASNNALPCTRPRAILRREADAACPGTLEVQISCQQSTHPFRCANHHSAGPARNRSRKTGGRRHVSMNRMRPFAFGSSILKARRRTGHTGIETKQPVSIPVCAFAPRFFGRRIFSK